MLLTFFTVFSLTFACTPATEQADDDERDYMMDDDMMDDDMMEDDEHMMDEEEMHEDDSIRNRDMMSSLARVALKR
jgi:hypothetical protein